VLTASVSLLRHCMSGYGVIADNSGEITSVIVLP